MYFKTNRLKITQSKQHREDRLPKKETTSLETYGTRRKDITVMALEYLKEKELQDLTFSFFGNLPSQIVLFVFVWQMLPTAAGWRWE